jgi:toxin ParE1/3/4
MRVVISEAAWADLLNIAINIKKHNAARASTFLDELYSRCQNLGVMPRAHQLIGGFEEVGIRRCVHGKYLIFYRIRAETVEILHVLHGAMDYDPLLFPEN